MKARIIHSPGYIPSFAAWCVSQGLPLCFEEVSTLDEIMVKTITDLKQCLAQERKLKRQSYNQFLWSSKNEDFNKEAYRRIKDQPFSPPVTSVVEKGMAYITISKKKFEGRFLYKLQLPLELRSLLQGQVYQCWVNESILTPHPLWEDYWTSMIRYPDRTQVQICWNEFRPKQLQTSFIRDWGQYWNRQDE